MNVFKRAKEAVMNFFGMTSKKGTEAIKALTTKDAGKNNSSMKRISRGSNMEGYRPRKLTKQQIFRINADRWKMGGTLSCIKAARSQKDYGYASTLYGY